jgi:hypothetical protein
VPGDHFFSLTQLGPVLAYGPAPGVELIPYFLGLLAWAGLALVSILMSPISALLRRLRRGKATPPSAPNSELTASEPTGEGTQDRP